MWAKSTATPYVTTPLMETIVLSGFHVSEYWVVHTILADCTCGIKSFVSSITQSTLSLNSLENLDKLVFMFGGGIPCNEFAGVLVYK